MLHNIGAIDLKAKLKTSLITRRGIKFIDSYCSDRTNECSPGLAFNLILLAAVADELRRTKVEKKALEGFPYVRGMKIFSFVFQMGTGDGDRGEKKQKT